MRHLIRVPSLPGEEGHVARLVRDDMEVLGYHEVTIDAAGNVIIIRGRGAAPPVMFNTHLDHVGVGGPSRWNYPGSGVPESGWGAHLRPGNELWIGLRDGFTVRLDFSRRAADPTVPCQTGGPCQYANAFGDATSVVIGETSYAEIQSNVVDGDDTTPSLMDVSMDPDNPSSARLLISFYDANGKLWNFNFSDARNSGAWVSSAGSFPSDCWHFR